MLVVNKKFVAVAVLLLVIAVMVWYNSKDKNVEGFYGPTRHPARFYYEGSTNSSNCEDDKIISNCNKYNYSRNSIIRNLKRQLCRIHSKNRCNRVGGSQPATVQAVQAPSQGSTEPPRIVSNAECFSKSKEYYADPTNRNTCITNRIGHCNQAGNSSPQKRGECIKYMDKCCNELHGIKPPCYRRQQAGFEPC